MVNCFRKTEHQHTKTNPTTNNILENANTQTDQNLENNILEAEKNRQVLVSQEQELMVPLLNVSNQKTDKQFLEVKSHDHINENRPGGSSKNFQNIINGNKASNQSFSTRPLISSKDIRTAIMLFVVTFLYILFFSPSMIATNYNMIRSLNMAKDGNHDEIPFLDGGYILIFYLYYLNSAINPIIYCFLNSTFRKDLKKIFFSRDSCYNSYFFKNN